MDLAAELGVGLCRPVRSPTATTTRSRSITGRPGADSSNRCGRGGHRPEVKLALEFQPHEPHARVMLSNVGKLLHVCAKAGSPTWARISTLAIVSWRAKHRRNQPRCSPPGSLFYIHRNDNTGDGGDWDMISGSVHWWHWLELLYTLDRVGYEGWIGGDIAVKHIGPKEAYDVNTRMLERMTALIERMSPDTIDRLIAEDNPARTMEHLSRSLVPDGIDERNACS